MSDRKFASFAEERRHMMSEAKVKHQLISIRDRAQKLCEKMADGGFGAEVDHLVELLRDELDESRELVPPLMEKNVELQAITDALRRLQALSICEHCGKSGELHKVKCEDDSGVGSMFVCSNCDGE